MDSSQFEFTKPRQVKLQIKTSMDICIWSDEYNHEILSERTKDDFINQVYLRGYLEDHDLVLNGQIVIRENDWKVDNRSQTLNSLLCNKVVRDIQSLATSGILSDFTFVIDGRELEVHKAILAGE